MICFHILLKVHFICSEDISEFSPAKAAFSLRSDMIPNDVIILFLTIDHIAWVPRCPFPFLLQAMTSCRAA